jgi:predicted RNA-binding protein YlxR (DUF448 family)
VGEPERQCIGCGRRGPQGDFLRFTVLHEAGIARVVVVQGGEHRGRGAYLCRRRSCLERALLRKAFQRAFRISAVVPKDEIAAFMGDWNSDEPESARR